MFSAGKQNFHAGLDLFPIIEINVRQQILNAGDQILGLIRFGNEIIGAALQSLEDIFRIRKFGQ